MYFMEIITETKSRKLLTSRLIILLVILAVGIVIALYMWLVYVPYMLENMDDFGMFFEELNLDGDGTVAKPYLIKTVEDLAELAEKVNNGSSYRDVHFMLVNNLDMTEFLSPEGAGYNDGAGWLMIGSHWETPFSGIFDGLGYTISGLWLNRPEEMFGGLFGTLNNASIYRLNVEAERIIAINGGAIAGHLRGGIIQLCTASVKEPVFSHMFGALVGWAWENAVVDNCSTSGSLTVTTNNTYTLWFGGLIGVAHNATVTNSHVNADITIRVPNATVNAGGLIGYLREDSVVNNCRTAGSITIAESKNSKTGGLIGHATGMTLQYIDEEYVWVLVKGTSIKNSSSAVNISGTGTLGGFVGELEEGTEISHSFATGDVICTNEASERCIIGGFVGESSGTIRNSFATGNVETTWWCDHSGGFAGFQVGGLISDSFSTGSLSSRFTSCGGFVGGQQEEGRIINCYALSENAIHGFVGSRLYKGIIENSYFDSDVAEVASWSANEVDELLGRTTAEMQNRETFEGWDFMNIWYMPEGGGYPRLRQTG
jgi:hypothetical protein